MKLLLVLLLAPLISTAVLAVASASIDIDGATLDLWAAPYRGWHYWPDHVVPARPEIGSITNLLGTDVPTVYQVPGRDQYFMSFIGFDGRGYQSFVAESADLVHWGNKISLVYSPKNDTFYMFYNAVPGKNDPTGGRGIGLITSKPLAP
jgi:hypothetical protein